MLRGRFGGCRVVAVIALAFWQAGARPGAQSLAGGFARQQRRPWREEHADAERWVVEGVAVAEETLAAWWSLMVPKAAKRFVR